MTKPTGWISDTTTRNHVDMTDQPTIIRARRCHCGHLVLAGADQDLHVIADGPDAERVRAAHATDERTRPPRGADYRSS